MTLTNVSPEQLAAIRNNFENIIVDIGDEGKGFNVTITLETELDYWKLFFSGADYTLVKMGRTSLNIKP